MRISDWSSDVCSSDLIASSWRFLPLVAYLRRLQGGHNSPLPEPYRPSWIDGSTLVNKGNQPMLRKLVVVLTAGLFALDRKSVVEGKSVSVRVDLGGRRIIKKKTTTKTHIHYIT